LLEKIEPPTEREPHGAGGDDGRAEDVEVVYFLAGKKKNGGGEGEAPRPDSKGSDLNNRKEEIGRSRKGVSGRAGPPRKHLRGYDQVVQLLANRKYADASTKFD